MRIYSQNSNTKRILAGLLAVWMSGVVFLFCCGGVQNAQAATSESCPLARMGHCDKSAAAESLKDENTLKFENFQNDNLAVDCCGFFPIIFNKERNVEKSTQIAEIPAKLKIEAPAPVFIKVKPTVPVIYNPPLLTQSGTYLRNRVFRI